MMPFFCFFGGKWRAAPHYPAPVHPVIVEPFAGAAGYSTRYPDRQVRLYDADPLSVGVWDYLIRVSGEEVMRLPAAVSHVDEVKACQEAKWLIGFWLNKGAASPCKTPSRWMRDGLRPGSYWGKKIRARIASQVGMVKHWKVWNKSFSDIRYSRDACWFVDPPYQVAGAGYRYRDVDYAALGRWCQGRRGQVMVCENAGATWLPFAPFRSIKGSPGASRSGRSEEVLWVNRLPDRVQP